MNTLGSSAVIGGALGGAQAAKFAQQYAQVQEYEADLIVEGREALTAGRPLPQLPEPPRPVLRISKAWAHLWWIVGLALAILPPLLIAIVATIIAASATDEPGQAIGAFMLSGLVAAVPSIFLAVCAAVILFSIGSVVKSRRKVEYDVARRIHEAWEQHEQARLAFERGEVPTEYLASIGLSEL